MLAELASLLGQGARRRVFAHVQRRNNSRRATWRAVTKPDDRRYLHGVNSSEREFEIDRTGVALIVLFGVVVVPATVLASVWVLTDGLDLAAAGVFELIVAGLSCLLALFIIRATVVELRGSVGVRIDELGIAKGSFELAWDEVETLEAPAFGLLEIGGKGQRLRLRTYLFRNRIELLEYIARRTGKQVPEMGHSY
jgi:hypothetical protein